MNLQSPASTTQSLVAVSLARSLQYRHYLQPCLLPVVASKVSNISGAQFTQVLSVAVLSTRLHSRFTHSLYR